MDLLAVAAASATAARSSEGRALRLEHAQVAKVALEAASLAQNIGPGEIDRALGELQNELAAAGLLAVSMEMEPADFLREVLRAVVGWRERADDMDATVRAYMRLVDLCDGLERDFTAGDSPVSRRIAARIHTALEDAAAMARGGGQ
jgi:hypothetical protein